MSYRALYRVWRPQHFRDLVGQEHVTTTLANSLTGGQISHAYLFSGPRGTGKTSAAKIFAKAVNCLHGPAAEPCNECESCRAITEGSLLDVIEIDAASNRGVDEIRDLRDKVKYAPTEVRYKVYIIDEVHMLTTEAFNALLKTLEEPPSHVIFILATTEPHKLPATIISRCQRFPFRRIPHHCVVQRLQHVVDQEGISADVAALEQIARVADGGLRDALSLLDQAISFSGKTLTEEVVLSIVGGVSEHSLLQLLTYLHEKDRSAALNQLDEFIVYGIEIDQVVRDLLLIIRDLLLAKTAVEKASISETIKNQSSGYRSEELMYWIEQLVLIEQQLKWVNHPQILLELFILKQTSTSISKQQEVMDSFYEQPPQVVEKVAPVEQVAEKRELVSKVQKAPAKTTNPNQGSRNSSIDPSISRIWPDILHSIKQQRVTLHAWLADGEIVETSDYAVTIAMKGAFHRDTVLKPENKKLIEQELEKALHKTYELKAWTREEWERQRGKDEISIATSAEAKDSDDDIVKKAISLFGEELVTIEK
ncbi:DNA polymerase III subunit gamma/tau [Shimazuella sp. AN120528]|uniref:DNA polymerase III subunit gamma/tau n=1 Tax=Shimazuella soli TaxID=1892854 RepID=UPI001F0F87B2|nr:DNA polymerase III subunit gamma/tau [Shimazuella soli]MCH5584994.1 DNA polymerase III subunit gamma/tau [Shimazuella soli]